MTSIEWTDETWNPVTGCDRVSPGCAHCYALEYAGRLKAMGPERQPKYQRDGDPRTSGPGFGVTLHESELGAPLRWRKPRLMFVNSMSDLFHEQVPDEFIDQVFWTMGVTQRHTYQVLTKRPERMRDYLANRRYRNFGFSPSDQADMYFPIIRGEQREGDTVLPNVWLGTSIENRRFVHRADVLRQVPAAVRFISAEPLLGPLVPHKQIDPLLTGERYAWYTARHFGSEYNNDPGLDLTGIDWLIVGGESGPRARAMHEEWARDLRDACQRDHDDVTGVDPPYDRYPRWAMTGTAFFFKQWGGRTPKAGGRLLDGREWNEFPARKAVAA